MIEIPSLTLEQWVALLKPYQQEIFRELLKTYSPEEAAEKWLSANGPDQTGMFGGAERGTTKPFFNNFQMELKKFICGDPSYEEARKEISEHKSSTGLIVISIISAKLGPILGVLPTLLIPVTALMLVHITKAGIKAYCCEESTPQNNKPPNTETK